MNYYIGKICPYCNMEIKEGDLVKVCPACDIPHHKTCWEENHGCTTFACPEQHQEEQNRSLSGLCPRCGANLQGGQRFCPKCGLQIGVPAAADMSYAMSQHNSDSGMVNGRKNRNPLIIGVITAVAVLAVILTVIYINNKGSRDFNKMFSDIARRPWCHIAKDGSYMKIDTNPSDIEDYIGIEAYSEIEVINSRLGFSSALFNKMGETSALDGRQTDSNEKVTVSWKYHPDSGLEVTYEWK